MKRNCKSCNKDSLSGFQIFLLGFGTTITCKVCRAKLRLNSIAQMFFSMFLTFLTIGLLVILTNSFGVFGFISAFIIPLIVDIVISLFLPIKVVN